MSDITSNNNDHSVQPMPVSIKNDVATELDLTKQQPKEQTDDQPEQQVIKENQANNNERKNNDEALEKEASQQTNNPRAQEEKKSNTTPANQTNENPKEQTNKSTPIGAASSTLSDPWMRTMMDILADLQNAMNKLHARVNQKIKEFMVHAAKAVVESIKSAVNTMSFLLAKDGPKPNPQPIPAQETEKKDGPEPNPEPPPAQNTEKKDEAQPNPQPLPAQNTEKKDESKPHPQANQTIKEFMIHTAKAVVESIKSAVKKMIFLIAKKFMVHAAKAVVESIKSAVNTMSSLLAKDGPNTHPEPRPAERAENKDGSKPHPQVNQTMVHAAKAVVESIKSAVNTMSSLLAKDGPKPHPKTEDSQQTNNPIAQEEKKSNTTPANETNEKPKEQTNESTPMGAASSTPKDGSGPLLAQDTDNTEQPLCNNRSEEIDAPAQPSNPLNFHPGSDTTTNIRQLSEQQINNKYPEQSTTPTSAEQKQESTHENNTSSPQVN
ncbi:MAG: hypothetical protein ACOVQX_01990 [Legionella sp.]